MRCPKKLKKKCIFECHQLKANFGPESPSFGEKSIRKISKDLKKLRTDSINTEKNQILKDYSLQQRIKFEQLSGVVNSFSDLGDLNKRAKYIFFVQILIDLFTLFVRTLFVATLSNILKCLRAKSVKIVDKI